MWGCFFLLKIGFKIWCIFFLVLGEFLCGKFGCSLERLLRIEVGVLVRDFGCLGWGVFGMILMLLFEVDEGEVEI